VPNLDGKDPDDAFSSVPYEKGYTFLSHLESVVGKEKWNKYIPHVCLPLVRSCIRLFSVVLLFVVKSQLSGFAINPGFAPKFEKFREYTFSNVFEIFGVFPVIP